MHPFPLVLLENARDDPDLATLSGRWMGQHNNQPVGALRHEQLHV